MLVPRRVTPSKTQQKKHTKKSFCHKFFGEDFFLPLFSFAVRTSLGGGFKYFLKKCSSQPAEMIQFDLRIFFILEVFNHQLVVKAKS